VLLLGLLLASTSYAAMIYRVSVNTIALVSNAASAPYFLDFQFNNGSVLGNNTATVSNFNYFGGGATPGATIFDAATGNIATTVTFNNSGSFQELYQAFTPSAKLGFDVTLTTNIDPVTPDASVFAILDKTLANLSTTGLGDSLLLVNLNSAEPIAQTFAGTGAFAAVTVASVPEPEAYALLIIGLLGFVARRTKHIREPNRK
jgi:hypothetical protein